MKTKVNVMKKVLGFVLTLVIMCGMLPMTSNAAEGTTTYYLNAGGSGLWDQADAWFAAWCWGDGVEGHWVKPTEKNTAGYYVFEVSSACTKIHFVRNNPEYSTPAWDREGKPIWNETSDLTLSKTANGCVYTIDNWDTLDDTKWSHVDSASDGVCDLCGAYTDGVGAKLAGYSLSVDGKIGVNFYMELDAAVVADASAKMHFTLPDGTTSDVLVSAATQETVAEKTYYVFTCEVAAKEMASDIKAKIVTSTAEGTEYTYTVRDYADALIARSTSDAEKAFVKAMLNYGASSQTYFNFNASDLANKNLAEGDKAMPAGASIAESLATNYAAVTTGTLGTFKSNLILNSETTLKVYFTPAVGVEVESIKVDETPVELVKSGDDYVVAIEDINATEIDSVKTITVTAADATTTTLSKCSPLAYGYSVLNANDREALSNVIVALRLYNQAADAYVGN